MAGTNFEKDLEKLEEIVGALEDGELALDDALKRFEEGIKLARRCEKALAEAEKKIEILTKNEDGALEAQPFDEEAGTTGPAPRKKRAAAPCDPDNPPEPPEPPEADDEEGCANPDELLF